jgi:hypothetical protein
MTGSLKKARRYLLLLPIAISGALLAPAGVLAATAPGLGTATSFAVLAGTTVTNTNTPTVITGDLGVSPGTAVTGFPPGTVSGAIHAGDAQALSAQNDLTTAYNAAAASPCNSNSLVAWGGQTLTPGTYCQTTSPTISGILTLSGNGVFIFKTGSTLVTAPGATVQLINGALPCNVFWQVGSSATLDTTTSFAGTIMALTSISLNSGAGIAGRALARNGAVTLDNNKITNNCSGPPPVVSEAPLTILIPLAALAILTTAVVLRRRRVRIS